MATFIGTVATFYAVWAGLLFLGGYVRYRGNWRPDLQTDWRLLRLAAVAEPVLILAPVLFMAWYVLGSPAPRLRLFSSLSGPETMLVFLLWQPLIAAVVTRFFAVRERRAAGGPDSRRLRRAWWIKARWHLLMPLLMVILVPIGPRLLLFGLVAVWFVRMSLTLWGRYSASSGFDFEPTPLREEITRIAEWFGIRIVQLRVRPTKTRMPRPEAPLLEPVLWGARGDIRNARAIPLVHVQELDPDVLTAALAHAWARTVISGTYLADVTIGPVSRLFAKLFGAGFGCMSFLVLGGMGSAVLRIIAEILDAGNGIVIFSSILYFVVLAAGIVYGLGRNMGKYPTAYESHKNALEAWRSAELSEDRDVISYVVAIARYRAYSEATRDVDILVLQLRRDRGLKRLLDSWYTGADEEAFEAVRQVFEPSPVAADVSRA